MSMNLTITSAAAVALRAAKMRHQIGRDAALRMVLNAGVDSRLYFLASRLEAVKRLREMQS